MKTAIPLLLYVLCGATIAFQISIPSSQRWTLLAIQQEEDGYPVVVEPEDTKFGFFQRAESLKCFVVGSVVGSVALVPFALVHNLLLTPSMIDTNGLAQFEFATDASGIQTGLFAIVYRYCIRTDTNPQLQDGVVGAFAITRALSGIVIPPYCTAIVLNCKFQRKNIDAYVAFSSPSVSHFFLSHKAAHRWDIWIGICWVNWL